MDEDLRDLERKAPESPADRMNYARALLRIGDRREAAVQAGKAYSEDPNAEEAERLSLSYTGLLRIIHRKIVPEENPFESDGTGILVYEPDKEPLLFKSSAFALNSIDEITATTHDSLLINDYVSYRLIYKELDKKGIRNVQVAVSRGSSILLVSPSRIIGTDPGNGSIYNENYITQKRRILVPNPDYLDLFISDWIVFADNTGDKAEKFPYLKELAPNSVKKECKKVREQVLKVNVGSKKYAISLPEPVRFLREGQNQAKKRSDLLVHLRKTDSANTRFSTTIEVPAIVLDNLRSYAIQTAGPNHGQIIE